MAKKTNKEKKIILKTDDNSKSSKSTSTKTTKAKTSTKSGGSKTSKSTKKSSKTAAERRMEAMKKKYGTPKESKKSLEQRHQRQKKDKLLRQLEKRVKEANEIVSEYGDYGHLQPIFADARRTLPPTRKKSEELFTADIKSEQAMMRELARIDIFEAQVRGRRDDYYENAVTDKSTKKPLTAEQRDRVDEIRRNFYKGALGGQWMRKNEDHETYDKSRIVKEFAEEAFSIYSHLTESTSEDYIKMLWNKKLGKSVYESESLIIEIYDMVSMGYGRKYIEDFLEHVKDQLSKDYAASQFTSPFDYEEVPKG